MCGDCGTLSCEVGRCVAQPSTGGGTATGGGMGSQGGGTSSQGGGAVGHVDQELVSGTRLRAIVFAGKDGSKQSANFFWDTQLQTYCAFPLLNADFQVFRAKPGFKLLGSSNSCNPLQPLKDHPNWFADSSCMTRAAVPLYEVIVGWGLSPSVLYNDLLVGAALPLIEPFRIAALSDGGWAETASSPSALYYGTPDGGCTPSANGAVAYPLGRSVAAPDFAVMSPTRE